MYDNNDYLKLEKKMWANKFLKETEMLHPDERCILLVKEIKELFEILSKSRKPYIKRSNIIPYPSLEEKIHLNDKFKNYMLRPSWRRFEEALFFLPETRYTLESFIEANHFERTFSFLLSTPNISQEHDSDQTIESTEQPFDLSSNSPFYHYQRFKIEYGPVYGQIYAIPIPFASIPIYYTNPMPMPKGYENNLLDFTETLEIDNSPPNTEQDELTDSIKTILYPYFTFYAKTLMRKNPNDSQYKEFRNHSAPKPA